MACDVDAGQESNALAVNIIEMIGRFVGFHKTI